MKTNKTTTMLELIKKDPWLKPFEQTIKERYNKFLSTEKEITQSNSISLSDVANGHMYYGLNRTIDGWTIREWAPNATEIYLIGSFNEWKQEDKYRLKEIEKGVWELKLPANSIHHLDYY